MKSIISVALLVLLFAGSAIVDAFSFMGSGLKTSVSNGKTISMEYIPNGMSKEQWAKIKAKERQPKKNLGRTGITTFKSRSFDEWQKSGGKNLFPVDPRTVKNPKDLPYMQRPGGSADDSDIGSKNPFANLFKKKAKPEPVVEE